MKTDSYGILVEVLRDNAPKPEPIVVYGPDGKNTQTLSVAIEEPGKYFHPLLATLITSAARLMLSITERLAKDQGLGWAFCDTDSLALARPEEMTRDDFRRRARGIVDWFAGLNLYDKQGSILQIEDVNFDPNSSELKPLYCYAVSAKRYALFNLTGETPVIRKASAHGLGHLLPPYTGPLPHPELGNIGVILWQHDVWQAIIQAALAGHPNQVNYDYHPALKLPAFQRYGATSPAILRWMKCFNDGKPYNERVKPFGFMMAPMARTGAFANAQCDRVVMAVNRGAPKKTNRAKPICTFERNPALASQLVVDRETGVRVQKDDLKTVSEALANYHLSTEDKFENGGPWDCGRTRRRHVQITDQVLVGKEANKVGKAGEVDPICGQSSFFGSAKKAGL